ncbi:hypothetical protein IMSAGC013_02963 [Lachnospiraceae bacterium]|nr:hypothetical protein IMSAGC013_02963 [Lachnospiraceae bacterium]
MRIRRVGSVTCGILMILFGILFLVHMFYPPLSLEVIMKLWPLILIALGGEMLASNIRKDGEEEVLKYDKGAVFLVFLLTCFAAGMGFLEYCMDYYAQYGVIYY